MLAIAKVANIVAKVIANNVVGNCHNRRNKMDERLTKSAFQEFFEDGSQGQNSFVSVAKEDLETPITPKAEQEQENKSSEVSNESSTDELYDLHGLAMAVNASSNRTVRYWVGQLKEIFHWLPEDQIQVKQGRKVFYTQFTCNQVVALKEALDQGKTVEEYKLEVWALYPESQTKVSAEAEPAQVTYLSTEVNVPSYLNLSPSLVEAELLSSGENLLNTAIQARKRQQETYEQVQAVGEQDLKELALLAVQSATAEKLERSAQEEKVFSEAFQNEIRLLQVAETARLKARQTYGQLKSEAAQNLGKQQ